MSFRESQLNDADARRIAGEEGLGFGKAGYMMLSLRGFKELSVELKICLMELAGELEGIYSLNQTSVTNESSKQKTTERLDKVLDLNQRLADANVPARFLEAADLTARVCAFASRTISTNKRFPFTP